MKNIAKIWNSSIYHHGAEIEMKYIIAGFIAAPFVYIWLCCVLLIGEVML